MLTGINASPLLELELELELELGLELDFELLILDWTLLDAMLDIARDATLLLNWDELRELIRLDETWLGALLDTTDDETMIAIVLDELLDEITELLFVTLLATELFVDVVLEEELVLSSPDDAPPQPTRSPSKIQISACFMCYLIPRHENKYKGIVLPEELFGCDPIRNENGIDVQFCE